MADICVFCLAEISPGPSASEGTTTTTQIASDIPNLETLCNYLRISVPIISLNVSSVPCNKFLCLSCFEKADFLKGLCLQLKEIKEQIKDAKRAIKNVIITHSSGHTGGEKEVDFIKIFGDNVKLAFRQNTWITTGDLKVKQEQEDKAMDTFCITENEERIKPPEIMMMKLDAESQKDDNDNNQSCNALEDKICSSFSGNDSDEKCSDADENNTERNIIRTPDKVSHGNNEGTEVTTSHSSQDSIGTTRQAKQFQCPMCKKSYDRVKPFAHHIAKNHSDQSSEGIIVANVGNRKTIMKNQTKEKEEKRSLRAQSEILVDGKTVLQCPHCQKHYERVKSLRNHIARNHAPEFKTPRTFTCSQCPSRSFRFEASLSRHMFAAHTTGPKFKCDQCDKAYHSKQYLKQHIKSDHEGVRYPCPQCSKDFGDTARLKQHVRLVHTGEGLHECQICGKKYVMPSDLRNHVIKHDENATKQYICDICGKNFLTLERLRGHRYLHKAERKHQCPHCSETFKEPRHLVHHIRRHTGEKPFKCQICQRPFAQKVAMEAHVRTHQKQRSQKPHTRPNRKKPQKMASKNS